MQIKQHAAPRRDVAVLPLRGSTAAFRYPSPVIPGKTSGMSGKGMVGTCVFGTKTPLLTLSYGPQ